MYLSSYVLSND